MISYSDGLVNFDDIMYVSSMGRKQINAEQTPARLPAGTLDRIDAVMDEDEGRAEFIRVAVEKELKRRERR